MKKILSLILLSFLIAAQLRSQSAEPNDSRNGIQTRGTGLLQFPPDTTLRNTNDLCTEGTVLWEKFFDIGNIDAPYKILQTTDGGYITVGVTESQYATAFGNHGLSDYLVVKMDIEGKIQWQKQLGGSSRDEAYAIVQTNDGGYIIAGKSKSFDGNVSDTIANYNYWIVKLGSNGNLQWENSFGGSDDEFAIDIKQTNDGGFVIAGLSLSTDGDVTGNHGSSDYWVIKIDNTGILQWEKSFGGSGIDEANSIEQTLDGGFIIAGSSTSMDGDVTGNHGDKDFWIVKIDSTGNLQWEKSFGGSGRDIPSAIRQTDDGGYIVAGHSNSTNGQVTGNHGEEDYWIVKMDNSGNLQWQRSLGGPKRDVSSSIEKTTDGGYIIAGYTYSNSGDVFGNHTSLFYSDFWVVKINNAGIIQWQKCIGGGNDDYGNSIIQSGDGGYVIAGHTVDGSGLILLTDIRIVRLSGPDPLTYYADVDNDGYGNMAVNQLSCSKPVGYVLNNLDCDDSNASIHPGVLEVLNSFDDNCDGNTDVCPEAALIWQKSFGDNSGEGGNSAISTSDGGYIVAGAKSFSYRIGQVIRYHKDILIVKFDNSGNLQWQKTFGGTDNDAANEIIQLTEGGYVIAGYSESTDGDVTGNHGGADYWIVKMDEAGILQWQKSFGGSQNDFAESIVQTTDGEYLVAGTTFSTNGNVIGNHGNGDGWVLKLDNIGNVVWQKCLGGSGYEEFISTIKASDGGYIITGYTSSNNGDVSGNHGSTDGWVVKIDNLGNIDWQKCFGGSKSDFFNSLKATTDGGYIAVGGANSRNGDLTVNNGESDYWIVKMDNQATLQWQKTFGGNGYDDAASVIQTTDGGFIVSGTTNSTTDDITVNHGYADFWILKLNSSGNLEWQKSFGGSAHDNANALISTEEGAFLVAGSSSSNDGDITGNNGSSDIWVITFTGKTGILYYADADGDGYGNNSVNQFACTPPANYVLNNADCDDTNAAIYPGAIEVCNGVDDNCDNQIDEGFTLETYYNDADGDGYGDANDPGVLLCQAAAAGKVLNNTDCDDNNNNIHMPVQYFIDADQDGYGSQATQFVCSLLPPIGLSTNSNDCDDNNPAVFPIAQNRPYRTKQDGDWSFSSTWEQFNGCNWVPGGVPDEDAGTITISHLVTVNSAGIVGGDEIVITGTGGLVINSRFFLRDGPGDDLVNNSGQGITLSNGGILSGTGTVRNNSRADVYNSGVIAVPFHNYGNFYFTYNFFACGACGYLNMTDGLTSGSIENYGFIFIDGNDRRVTSTFVNGQFYNHSGAEVQVNNNALFDVNKFTNEGEFILGVTGISSGQCTIRSAQSSVHSGGRFKSNGNDMKFIMQTNGTTTYAADCIIDANMHYSTGIHNIFSTSYGTYDTRISTTVNCSGAEVNFPGIVYVDGGDFGGPAVKKITGSLLWWAGTVSGGNLLINNAATAHLGAGQNSVGILATTLVNNGTVNFATGYSGCCGEIVFTMTNGTIENNGQFIFHPTSGGGIRNQTLSGGTFNNNASGTLINNATAVSAYGDNETYLRNSVFTNNGTILANGVSLNIFPTTNPVIGGTITVAAGGQVKLGISSTTTTLASNAVINGAGRVYFFDGNHQVNTPLYSIGSTYIGQIYSAANVNFNASNVALDYLFIYSGVLGGPATKLLKDDMVFISGQLTGGSIENTDTSVCYFGAGSPGLGAINTAFTNNGVVEVSPYYGGCCTEPVLNLNGGSITNNGTFNVTGSGGIRYVGLSNGTFINNSGGVINSNVGDVSFGEPSFRMQPASFTNHGTINVLRNIMELGAFMMGGSVNVSPGALLRSTGTVTFNGSLINNNGNITVPFDFINAAAKTLKGNGTFTNNVTLNNAAAVAPGSSPGILTVAGNYTQGNAALDIEIGGSAPGTGHDRLAVTGAATVSGTLNATEVNGFNPQSFTSIDILTASSVTGTFSQVNLPPFWSVQYAPNKVSLVKFLEYLYYRDQDNDGFGNVADTIRRFATTAPAGYTTDSTDCDDANAAVNPGATEICNGIDDNCDGIVDTLAMPGLILYMPMNGNAIDMGGNGLNGTIFGSVTGSTDRFGNPTGAMSFPGNTSSYIRVNDQPLLRPSSITLSAWVRMASQPGLTGFINKSINCYNDSWHFGSQGGNYSTWVSNSTNCGDFLQMTSPNSVGNWRHVVYTLDDLADTRRMYVDGNLVASGSYTSSIPYDGNPVLIGAAIENGNLDFPFHGSLDDVMIFGRAIPETEVKTLFTQGSPFQALTAVYYADADGDGFGNPEVSQVACTQPSGYVLNNTDCNDNSAAVYPGATEVCDGLDNDCDGQIDLVINNTGLVAYYPFSGNANDAKGALNGTVNGATLTTDRFGNANSAYSFDGINDFISTSNVALTQTDNWSMSAWVKPAASSSDVIVVQNGGDGSGVSCNGYSLGLNNLAVTGYHPCVAFLNSGATVPQANQWILLTMVRQSGVTRFYFNGVQAPTTFTSEPITPAGVITIGSASGIRFFNGSIDDVKIYNVALTPTQILQDFNTVPLSQAYYADTDGDGFGNPAVSQLACSQPPGYVLNNTDCDDNSAAVYAGATEVCDGIDNDCDGNIDAIVTTGIVCGMATSEGQSFTLTAPPGKVFTSVDFASYGTPDGTCGNFTLGNCHATSTLSIVQGLVIGQNSVTLTQNYQIFGDPCVGVFKRFYVQARYSQIIPLAQTYYSDADGDGFGNPAVTITGNCGSPAPTGYVSNSTDCDDSNARFNPSVTAGTVTGIPPLCPGSTALLSTSGTTGGTWLSRNPNVATVNAAGMVTGVGNGSTRIVYTVNNCTSEGSSDSITVTVATQYVWTGAGTNAHWNNPDNWTDCGIPAPGADVTVNDVPNQPLLNVDVTVGNLQLNGNAALGVNGRTLTINGGLSGTGRISTSPSSSLVIAGNAGTLRFTAGKDTIGQLTLQSNASAVLGNMLFVKAGNPSGLVTLQQGAVLNANGNLTLLSDISGTARIATIPVDGAGNALAAINGDVVVERFIPRNTYKAWHMLSIPTRGPQTIKQGWQENQPQSVAGPAGYGTTITTASGFLQNGFDAVTAKTSIQSFNPANGGLLNLTSTNIPSTTRYGYFIYVRGDRSVPVNGNTAAVNTTRLRTKGTLYTGNQPALSSGAANRYLMVGNIYPSAIDFTLLPKTGGIGNTFYIWDPKLNNGTTNLGGYQTFSSTNDYQPTVAGGSYSGPNTRIESGQAFFVYASGSAGTIQMVEAAKVGGAGVNAFRPLPKESAITVKLATEVKGTLFTADASTVVFDGRFTDAVNTDDARKLLNPGENIATVTDQQLFAVEAKSSILQQEEIQYHLSHLRLQAYQLQINCRNVQERGVELYLEDKFLNRMIPVTGNSFFIYSFTVSADAGSGDPKRFRLLIRKKQLAPSPSEAAGYITVNPNPAEAARFNLNVYGIAGGKYRLTLTDQKGAVVHYEKISLLQGNSSSLITLENKPAAGIYQVELSDGKRSRYMTRIVFK